MLTILLLSSCLVDHETYQQRLSELTDDDSDGFSEADGDCNDADPSIYPLAPELCDGIDNDCDRSVDDEDPDLDTEGYFIDSDRDGYGGPTSPVNCDDQPYWSNENTDCNDEESNINPGAPEVCGDGLDNNCNQSVEECRFAAELSALSADSYWRGSGSHMSFGSQFLSFANLNDSAAFGAAVASRGVGRETVHLMSQSMDAQLSEFPSVSASSVDDLPGFATSLHYIERTSVLGDSMVSVSSAVGATLYPTSLVSSSSAAEFSTGVFLDLERSETADEVVLMSAGDFDTNGIDNALLIVVAQDAVSTVALLREDVWDAGEHVVDALSSVETTQEGLWVGSSFGYAGDLDADGLGEICLGAPFWSGSRGLTGGAVVISPAQLTDGFEAEASGVVLEGRSSGDALGLGGCRSLGDLNGDGYDDLAVGALLSAAAGASAGEVLLSFGSASYLASPPIHHVSIQGEATNDLLGFVTGTPGDLDGDNHSDLVIGASQQLRAGAGALYLFYGPFEEGTYSASNAHSRIVGDGSESAFGYGGFIGDTDGDGLDDLLLTAPGAFDSAGAAYLFLGSGI